MSFFKEVGKWIKGWHLERLFSSENLDKLTELSTKAVILGQQIKKFVHNEEVDTIVALTNEPHLVEDVEDVRGFIDKVVDKAAEAEGCLKEGTLGEKIICLNNMAEGKDEDGKTKFYHNLVGELGVALAKAKGEPYKLKDFFGLIELVFRQIFGKKD